MDFLRNVVGAAFGTTVAAATALVAGPIAGAAAGLAAGAFAANAVSEAETTRQGQGGGGAVAPAAFPLSEPDQDFSDLFGESSGRGRRDNGGESREEPNLDIHTAEKKYQYGVPVDGHTFKESGCTIRFPKNSFEDYAIANTVLSFDQSKHPPGYVMATNTVECKFDQKLKTDLEMELDTVFEAEHPNDNFYVLREVSGKWEVIGRVARARGNKVRFMLAMFGRFVVAVKESDSDYAFRVNQYLYATKDLQLLAFVCPNHSMLEKRHIKYYRQFGCLDVPLIKSDTVLVKSNQVIESSIECLNPGCSIWPCNKFVFKFEKMCGRNPGKRHKHLRIRSEQKLGAYHLKLRVRVLNLDQSIAEELPPTFATYSPKFFIEPNVHRLPSLVSTYGPYSTSRVNMERKASISNNALLHGVSLRNDASYGDFRRESYQSLLSGKDMGTSQAALHYPWFLLITSFRRLPLLVSALVQQYSIPSMKVELDVSKRRNVRIRCDAPSYRHGDYVAPWQPYLSEDVSPRGQSRGSGKEEKEQNFNTHTLQDKSEIRIQRLPSLVSSFGPYSTTSKNMEIDVSEWHDISIMRNTPTHRHGDDVTNWPDYLSEDMSPRGQSRGSGKEEKEQNFNTHTSQDMSEIHESESGSESGTSASSDGDFQMVAGIVDSNKGHSEVYEHNKILEHIENLDDLEEYMNKHCEEKYPLKLRITNMHFDREATEQLSRIIDGTEVIELSLLRCRITSDLLELLNQSESLNIKSFSITQPGKIGELSDGIIKLAKTSGTQRLSLMSNKMDKEDIDQLKDSLQKFELKKLEALDVSYNEEMGEEGLEALGEVLEICPVTELKMVQCNLADKELEAFRDILTKKGIKIPDLDLSSNRSMTTQGYQTLAEIVQSAKVQWLRLSDVDLTADKLVAFCATGNARSQITKLDVGYNKDMGKVDLAALEGAVHHWGVEEISLAGCRLNDELLPSFCNSIIDSGHKMKALSIADNHLSCDAMVDVAELVRKCGIVDLDISNCMLTSTHIREFGNALQETKLGSLDLSVHGQVPTEAFIQSVCNLLPRIKNKLYLRSRKLPSGCREMLKNNLNNQAAGNLQIVFNDGRLQKA